MAESDSEGCMYSWRVRAVEAALAQRGLSAGPLSVDQLTALGHLDQYHYYGTDACDEAIAVLGVDADRHVLDIGSGIGGPARYLAAETGCRVHGVEVRPDLVEAARELTRRTGLDDRVAFSADSAASAALDDDQYDHLVAWLVLLHIEERVAALSNCRRALRPGGTAFVEALVTDDPSPADRRDIQTVVEMRDPVSEAGLVDQFHAAGFADVVTCDLTDAWTRWTAVRYDRFQNRREQFVDLHGQTTYERRVEFYRTVRDLFAGGAVRGIRLTARVPGSDPLAFDGRDRTALSGRDPEAVLETDSHRE
jgi:cyclopropane fatty-acyl-phospholipid synthase-like methyltransferase